MQPGFAREPLDNGEGIVQLRMPNVSDHGFIDLTVSKRVEASDEERANYRVERGDVIFNNTNSPENVGNAAAFDEELECLFSNHMTRLRVRRDIMEPAFLALVLHGYWLAGYTRTQAKHWVNQAAVDQPTLSRFRIPVPPLSEQQRIVTMLQEAESMRRLRAQADRLTNEIAPALFHSMFFGPRARRNDWEPTTVEKEAASGENRIRTGPFGSDLLHSEFIGTGVPVLGIDNVVENHFRWTEPRCITSEKYRGLTRFRVHPRDVLITIMGTVGRSCVAPENLPECISTKHLCVITPNTDRLNPYFLWATFLYDNEAGAQARGAGRGAIMEGWNSKIVRSLRFRRPPIELQNQFEQRVRAALQSREQLLATEEIFSAFATSLLSHAFSGELTAKWRERHAAQLARDAAARDAALAALTPMRTRRALGPATFMPEELPTASALPHLTQRQRELWTVVREHVAQGERLFTPETLLESAPAEAGFTRDEIRRHLDVFTAVGLVIAHTRADEADAGTGYYLVWRLPELAENADAEPDFLRVSELSRLAEKLKKELHK